MMRFRTFQLKTGADDSEMAMLGHMLPREATVKTQISDRLKINEH